MPKANFVPIGDNGLLFPMSVKVSNLPLAVSFYPHPGHKTSDELSILISLRDRTWQ